jgi:hypothetical protein
MRNSIEEKIGVLAGNAEQAKRWAQSKGLQPSDYFYWSGTDACVGIHFKKFAKVGTYYLVPNLVELRFKASLEPDAEDVS